MSKSKAPSAPFGLLTNGASGWPDVGARTQALWQAQAAAAEHVRTFADGWWERRRQAATDAAACCAAVFSNGADPAAAAEAWSAWARGALDRLSEDAKAQTTLAGGLTGAAVSALGVRPEEEPQAKAAKGAASRSEDARSEA